MKDVGMLFSGEMVRAILRGAKTETRRNAKPRAAPGDCIWVRETWQQHTPGPDPDVHVGKPHHLLPVLYRADLSAPSTDDGPWRPSLFMPRWAARIWLLVTEVRREPLREITEAAAQAEGVAPIDGSHLRAYVALWDALNTTPGTRWTDNPEVTVYRFEVIR